jgi:colicin import membrane protein
MGKKEDDKAKAEAEKDDKARAKSEEEAKAKSRSLDKKPTTPDGLEADESKLMDSDMSVGDYASRIEAIEKARELLRREAQAGLNRRLGINPAEIVGVTFNKSWRNYFADGNVYGFSKKVAAALVKSGVARYEGAPKPSPKVTAQDLVDQARARRDAKAKVKADESEAAKKTVHDQRAGRVVDAAMKGVDAKAEAAKKEAEAKSDAALEAEFDAALKAEIEAGEKAKDAKAEAEIDADEKAKFEAEVKAELKPDENPKAEADAKKKAAKK